tara:strand:- start:387 stop:1661 length:1275 start_codon:yes stop_codon:yes gene_type:complete
MFDIIRDNISAKEEAILARDMMKNISYDFGNKDTLVAWQKRVWVLVRYQKSLWAYQLLRELSGRLQKTGNQSIQASYEPILVWLSYVAFDELVQEELLTFFKASNIGIIFNDQDYYDLSRLLRLRLSLEPMEARDKLREKIFNALHANEHVLTKTFRTEKEKGTIANWLKAYDHELGTDVADSLERAEFENKSSIAAHLDYNEKLLLKRFFDLYEFIKISSYDIAGFEEPLELKVQGKGYLFDQGKQIEMKVARQTGIQSSESSIDRKTVATQPISSTQKLASLPIQMNLTKQARQILIASNGNVNKVLTQLYESSHSGEVLGVLASLILLAQLRRLDNILEDQRFSSLVIQDLQKNNLQAQVQGMRINPAAPQYVARFLKIVLEDKLKLSHQDAISFGKKLVAILSIEGEKYKSIISDNKWKM